MKIVKKRRDELQPGDILLGISGGRVVDRTTPEKPPYSDLCTRVHYLGEDHIKSGSGLNETVVKVVVDSDSSPTRAELVAQLRSTADKLTLGLEWIEADRITYSTTLARVVVEDARAMVRQAEGTNDEDANGKG